MIKNILKTFFIACIVLCTRCQPASAQRENPVYLFSYFKNNGADGMHLAWSSDGYQWTALHRDSSLLRPRVGNEKLMRDPCILPGPDGFFHMVWTASWKDKGIGYARSKDLVHWSDQQFIPVMADEPGALNCWAPEITYDRAKRRYQIYWATSIPGRFAATDSSGDGKYNHRIYYVTTTDFTNFSKAAILYDPGFSVIDATIVPDGKGYLMFFKDETRWPPQKNLRYATAQSPAGPFSAPSAPITDTAYWAEGPTAVRINGQWLVYFDKYTQHKYGALLQYGDKKWKDVSGQIRLPAASGTAPFSAYRPRNGKPFAAHSKLRYDSVQVALACLRQAAYVLYS